MSNSSSIGTSVRSRAVSISQRVTFRAALSVRFDLDMQSPVVREGVDWQRPDSPIFSRPGRGICKLRGVAYDSIAALEGVKIVAAVATHIGCRSVVQFRRSNLRLRSRPTTMLPSKRSERLRSLPLAEPGTLRVKR